MSRVALLPRSKIWAIAAGPVAFVLLHGLAGGSLPRPALLTLCATAWIGVWWIFEAVPIAVTSLLPLVLLPVTGVRTPQDVASLYLSDLIFLLLGGFLLAAMIERWGLHRRMALFVLSRIGPSPRRLSLGFLLSSALLSMWISNTATTLMLIPIALGVAERLRPVLPAGDMQRVETALLLSIPYAANFGGLGTYIGTTPNLIFRERYAADFAAGSPGGPPAITFLGWFLAFAPMVLLFVPVLWVLLAWRLPRRGGEQARDVLRSEAARQAPWSRGETLVALVFAVTALLWITREPLELGERTLLGWARLLPPSVKVTDATVALAMVIVACLLRAPLPAADGEPHRSGPLLDWRQAEKRLPWGILLLFGAGLALGDTFKTSGLSAALAESLSGRLQGLGPTATMGSVCLLVTFLTEVTSNTATAALMLQILSAVAVGLAVPAAAVLLPAALSASCAFMLPVATGPNAIVFATERVPIRTMISRGFLLNLLAAAWITVYLRWVALPLLGIL